MQFEGHGADLTGRGPIKPVFFVRTDMNRSVTCSSTPSSARPSESWNMQTTNISVLARRVWIDDAYATLPYEAGGAATEAVFFIQAEGNHPDLTISPQVSPDEVSWIRRGTPVVLAAAQSLAELSLTTHSGWLRLAVTGASSAAGSDPHPPQPQAQGLSG